MKRQVKFVVPVLVILISLCVGGCKGDDEKKHEAAKAAWRDQMQKELSH